MSYTQSAIVYVLLILELFAVFAIAFPLTSHPYLPAGQPCETWITCNNSVILSQEDKKCDTCQGPNVCQVTTTYLNYFESGIYSCLGIHCHKLECLPVGVCNITVISSYTDYQCCYGYGKELKKGRSDYHEFYYPLPSEDTIKKEGCPRELNETICDCLETLKLTEFLSLLKETGLDDHLCNATNHDEYTVFAPTNEAIKKGDLSSLPTSELERVLMSHIIPGYYDSKRLNDVYGEESLAPGHYVHVDNSGPWASHRNVVNGERLLIEDGCKSLDGVVHVIDGLINVANKSIAQVFNDSPQFSILWSLIVKANLTKELNKTRKNTVYKTIFVPDNKAFEKASSELGLNVTECLSHNIDRDTLVTILKYHQATELIYCSELSQKYSLPTESCYIEREYLTSSYRKQQRRQRNFDSCILDIRNTDEGISVGTTGSLVTGCDHSVINGLFHIISLPLIPFHMNLVHLCSNQHY